MSVDPIPDSVRAFLEGRIDSVTQLDMLLLVHRTAGQLWTAQAVAAELRIGEAWAEEQLSLLARRDLLEREGSGYRFASAGEFSAAVDELARAYHTHPVAVVAAIYARPDRNLRNFADAFRLRKEPPGTPASQPPPQSQPAPGPPPSPAPPRPPRDEGSREV